MTLVVQFSAATEIEFFYDLQDEWVTFPGSFCNGSAQSPIDITNAQEGQQLIPLSLSRFDEGFDGEFVNTGHNVQFNPAVKKATIRNHLGTYTVQQFHFHWGRNDQEGSEHQIDGEQFSAEVHFVATKNGETDTSAPDYISVLGVLLEADPYASINDAPWNRINLNELIEAGSIVDGVDVIFEEFLPSDLSYYHYSGSLTTPLCDEIVQWFVLKEMATIPSDFLSMLRLVRDSRDLELTFNFRDLQALNGRPIFFFEDDDNDENDDDDSDDDDNGDD